MKNNRQTSEERKYPFKMSRLYVNAATVVLAVFMATVTLTDPLLLLLFILLTILIGAATFILKIRPLFKIQKPTKPESQAYQLGRRELYIVLIIVIVTILLPFLLFFSARNLPIYAWFAALASLATGIGISEILFYVYCTRML